MKTLTVPLGERSYPIHIGPGLLDDPALLSPHLARARVVIVTNEVVAPLYAERLARSLAKAGSSVSRVVIPDGEAQKSWQGLDQLHGELLALGADRKTVLAALGGGVVGDLAGFAAATFQRGIAFIQLPTTLLAQVDSSVGGKTAINHPLGKNMIGAFHQPRVVIADTGTLATLPAREFAAGLAEVIKYGVIRDGAFFSWLESNMAALVARDAVAVSYAIHRSCEVKADIVARDERESGVRALLNFGHTFGHAIEALEGYGRRLHGEAVAIGMVMASRFQALNGRMATADALRIERLVAAAGLPVSPPPLAVPDWLEAMGRDKKNEAGRITLILASEIGRATVEKDVPVADLEAFLQRP